MGHVETHLTVIGTDLLPVTDEPIQVPHLLSAIRVGHSCFRCSRKCSGWRHMGQGQDGQLAVAIPCPRVSRISAYLEGRYEEPCCSFSLSSYQTHKSGGLNPRIPKEATVAQVRAKKKKLEERARVLTTTSQLKVGTSQQHSEWRNLRKFPDTEQDLTAPRYGSTHYQYWAKSLVTRQERVPFLPFTRIFSGGMRNKGFTSRHHKRVPSEQSSQQSSSHTAVQLLGLHP